MLKSLNCVFLLVIMRPKTIRIIDSIHSKGVFGPCSCGGEVLYYTDRGVMCETCGNLYGRWLTKGEYARSFGKGKKREGGYEVGEGIYTSAMPDNKYVNRSLLEEKELEETNEEWNPEEELIV